MGGGKLPGQYQNIINQYRQFRNTYQGTNPREQVMNMLQSGHISQEQLNQYQQMARQIQNAIKKE